MKNKTIKISAIIGILILVYIIYIIGPEHILKNIKNISLINFTILFALRILYWLLRTINWKTIINKYGENLTLSHLFFARMSGHSVSQLTPSSQIGSEATRILMANASTKKVSIASIILDKTIEFFSVIFLTAIGIIVAFNHIYLSQKLKLFFILAIITFIFFILFIFFKQKRGILSWIVSLLDKFKFKIKFVEKNREKLRETDAFILEFYKNHKSTFLKVFFLYTLLIFLWVTEIHLTLKFIGIENISFIDSFIITTLGNIALIFPFIPGSIGIYEATYVGLCALVGINADVAITMVFIRRIIALALAGFGLLAMWRLGNLKKSSAIENR